MGGIAGADVVDDQRLDSYIDAVYDGGSSHSDTAPGAGDGDARPPEAPEAVPAAASPVRVPSEAAPAATSPDGAGTAHAAESPDSGLREEVENLKKRLHDTQASFHRMSQENSELRRRFEEMKENDPWSFLEDDGEDAGDPAPDAGDEAAGESSTSGQEGPRDVAGGSPQDGLEGRLEKSEKRLDSLSEQVERARQEKAEELWNRAAEAVRRDHSDFDDRMEYLVRKIEEDSVVSAGWQKESDKSPSAAYEYSRRLSLVLDGGGGISPEQAKQVGGDGLTGKEALDTLNSAFGIGAGGSSVSGGGSFVDLVYPE